MAAVATATATIGLAVGGARPAVQLILAALVTLALIVGGIISWVHRGREIDRLEDENGRFETGRHQLEAERDQHLERITGLEHRLAELAEREERARDDAEGAEQAFQRLRSVSIDGYQTSEDREYFEGFDEELQQALDERDHQVRQRRRAA
jgi:hypothetical protein